MILENYEVRNDELADRVRICVQGAVGDFHAAEARYHVDCRQRFYTPGRNLVGCSDDKLIGDKESATDLDINFTIRYVSGICSMIS